MPDRPTATVAPLSVPSRIQRDHRRGLPLINMALNENPFAPSTAVVNAIENSVGGVNRYGDPRSMHLLERIGETFSLPVRGLIAGNGSEELLEIIARSFVKAGDEILISQYGYIVFELIANRLNAKITKAIEKEFRTDVDTLLEAVTPATRLVFLANPNNPTGTLVSESELSRLVQCLPKHVVLVIDLAYGEFVGFDYCTRLHRLVENNNNVVVTRTFSKAFALAGLRAGWAHAPAWMIPVLYAVRGMGTINAVAQAAALASLSEIEIVRDQVSFIVSERDRIIASLRRDHIKCIDSTANFILLSMAHLGEGSANALVDFLFDETGIVVTPAREQGLEKCVRVSVAKQKHNDRLIETIQRFIRSIKT